MFFFNTHIQFTFELSCSIGFGTNNLKRCRNIASEAVPKEAATTDIAIKINTKKAPNTKNAPSTNTIEHKATNRENTINVRVTKHGTTETAIMMPKKTAVKTWSPAHIRMDSRMTSRLEEQSDLELLSQCFKLCSFPEDRRLILLSEKSRRNFP